MSIDSTRINGHPGFLAYTGKNVVTHTSNTSAEKQDHQDTQENNKDQQLAGGEQGKAE